MATVLTTANNYEDIWTGRVEQQLRNTDYAPFFNGIPEINSNVISVGEGNDLKQQIFLPATEFMPTVLLNNTTYPLLVEDYNDKTIVIWLDKYQTLPTSVPDDFLLGLSYNVIDAVTGNHRHVINEDKYNRALHSISPNGDSSSTPVLFTTGPDDGTGRKKLLLKDLVLLKKKLDLLHVPMVGRRLVLCPDHVADILEQNQQFANQFYDYAAGKVSMPYGFEIYESVFTPFYDINTGTKLPFGAVPGTDDNQASVVFYDKNIGLKTGLTKMYHDPPNTTMQTTMMNWRHYYVGVPKWDMYMGAIVSNNI